MFFWNQRPQTLYLDPTAYEPQTYETLDSGPLQEIESATATPEAWVWKVSRLAAFFLLISRDRLSASSGKIQEELSKPKLCYVRSTRTRLS